MTLVRLLFTLGILSAVHLTTVGDVAQAGNLRANNLARVSAPQSFDPRTSHANRFIFCESLNENNGLNNDQTQNRIRVDLAGVDKVVGVTRNGVSQEITEIRKVPGGTTEVTALSFDPIGAIRVSISSNDLIFASSGEIQVAIEVMGAPGTEIQRINTSCAVFP